MTVDREALQYILRKVLKKRKACRLCKNPDMVVDFRKPDTLKPFISETGKIIPRRMTNLCAKHQRIVTREIKRARNFGTLAAVIDSVR